MINFRLTFLQDTMINKQEFIDIGLYCADICKALDQGVDGRRPEDLSQPMREAINQLMTWVKHIVNSLGNFADDEINRRTVTEIQRKVTKQSQRNALSRFFHARNDKEKIAAWKLELDRILRVFNVRSVNLTWLSLSVPFQTELSLRTAVAVTSIHNDVSKIREQFGGQVHSVCASLTANQNGRMLTVS